jgi:hypothetical protein
MDEKKVGEVLATEGFPSLYTNHAAVSMSPVDIRVFFSEVSPKELNINPQEMMKAAEAIVTPRICLVMTPEFAKTVLESLSTSISQYETKFGPLRPAFVPPPNPAAKK